MLRLNRLYPKSLVKPQLRTILVPRPATRPVAGQPLRDQELLQWCTRLIDDVIAEPIGVRREPVRKDTRRFGDTSRSNTNRRGHGSGVIVGIRPEHFEDE